MKTEPRTNTKAHGVLALTARNPHRAALLAGFASVTAMVAGAVGLHAWESSHRVTDQGFAYSTKALTPAASSEAPVGEAIHGAIFIEPSIQSLDSQPGTAHAFGESLKLVGFKWGNSPTADTSASSDAGAQVAAAGQSGTIVAGSAMPGTATPANSPLLPDAAPGDTVPPASTKSAAHAATPTTDAARLVAAGLNADGKLQLAIGKQSIVKTNVKVARVSIGNAEIADVLVTSPESLLVTAKKSGSTQIIVWDAAGRREFVDVSINTDLAGLSDQMKQSLPGTPIEVAEANGAIILRGRVQSAQQAAQAQLLAEQYGKVVNFIEIAGGQRISVKVQFAEVSRSVQNDLGINWGFSDGRNVFGSRVGGLGTNGGYGFARENGISGILTPDPTSAVALFGRGLVGSNEFSYLVNALKQNNLMRMLAQPYITTNSGETGEIFAGGEFPVPVPSDSGGSPTIDYREFGIRLKCTPAALGNGNILMKVEYEVSDLDFSSAVNVLGVQVPGLRKRSGSQTIELAEGQTLPLGGLFDSQTVANISKVPGLGDIPYIGALFRSTSFQRRETELVVLITPDLAGPFNPDEIPALPGSGWRSPSDAEMAFHGDAGGDNQADQFRDQFRKPSERGASSCGHDHSRDGSVACGTQSTGYEAFSPLSKQANEPASTANSSKPNSAPPLFLGEAGYAPVDSGTANPAANTASVRE